MRTVLLIALAGCGAQLGSGEPSGSTDAMGLLSTDAPATRDAAPITPDAAPPCVEGDARMQTASGCFALFTAPKVRADAKAACAALGMHLAKILSQADQDVLTALATVDVAIGLSDVAVEGTFVWDDGTPLGAFQSWAQVPLEPNNANGAFEEDCVVFAPARPGWDDRPCAPPPDNTGAYAYLCQR